jgi:hypothetical protein
LQHPTNVCVTSAKGARDLRHGGGSIPEEERLDLVGDVGLRARKASVPSKGNLESRHDFRPKRQYYPSGQLDDERAIAQRSSPPW